MLQRAIALFGVIALMVVISAPAMSADDKADTHDGKVVKVDGEKLTMTDKAGKEHTHAVSKIAKVTIDGKDAKLADLKAGQDITVTVDKDKSEVTKIDAKK